FSRIRVEKVFRDAVAGASDAPSPKVAESLGRLLYMLHLNIILLWLLDKTSRQRATSALLSYFKSPSRLYHWHFILHLFALSCALPTTSCRRPSSALTRSPRNDVAGVISADILLFKLSKQEKIPVRFLPSLHSYPCVIKSN